MRNWGTLHTSSILKRDESSPAEKSLCTPACLPRRNAAMLPRPLPEFHELFDEAAFDDRAYLRITLILALFIVPPLSVIFNGLCKHHSSFLYSFVPKPFQVLQPHSLTGFFNMATDIRTSELKSPVDVAEYLFRRLHEVGVRGVHGVPGDYNLVYRHFPISCSDRFLTMSGSS